MSKCVATTTEPKKATPAERLEAFGRDLTMKQTQEAIRRASLSDEEYLAEELAREP